MANPPVPADETEVHGVEADFNAFLAAAMALPAERVTPFRADVSVLYANVVDATNAVLAESEALKTRHKATDEELAAVAAAPQLALALDFAVRQTMIAQGKSPTQIKQDITRNAHFRTLLLRSAQACEAKGLLTRADLALIEQGKGPVDAARDVVALVALFNRKKEVLAGKTPVDAADLKEAAEVAEDLLIVLRPEDAHAAPDATRAAYEAAADQRDRIWTLLNERADLIWELGTRLWKRKVSDHLPALQSRVVGPRPKTEDPTK